MSEAQKPRIRDYKRRPLSDIRKLAELFKAHAVFAGDDAGADLSVDSLALLLTPAGLLAAGRTLLDDLQGSGITGIGGTDEALPMVQAALAVAAVEQYPQPLHGFTVATGPRNALWLEYTSPDEVLCLVTDVITDIEPVLDLANRLRQDYKIQALFTLLDFTNSRKRVQAEGYQMTCVMAPADVGL